MLKLCMIFGLNPPHKVVKASSISGKNVVSLLFRFLQHIVKLFQVTLAVETNFLTSFN